MNDNPSLTEKPDGSVKGCMVVFGLIFVGVGLFFCSLPTVVAFLESRSSNHWVETKCTVVKSEIDINRDGDETTYRPLVEFTYSYDGLDYQSDTFDFTSVNRPQSRCRQIVDDHAVGTRMGCFVNPNSPKEAVIVRGYDPPSLGIFPLIFCLIGVSIIVAAMFLKDNFRNNKSESISSSAKQVTGPLSLSMPTSNQSSTPSSGHPGDIEDQKWDQPQKLKPGQSRLTAFLVISLFAMFWNGMIGSAIYGGIEDFGRGGDWFFLLFMIPFALVGLGLIGIAMYLLGSLFNPAVEIALSKGAVSRGELVDIAWQLSGRTSSIQSLKVTVEGEESATYQSGTDTTTDRNVFCTIPVADANAPKEIEFGSASVPIPANTMHTFSAERNNIKWRIVVHGKIPYWPNLKETFEFRVKP